MYDEFSVHRKKQKLFLCLNSVGERTVHCSKSATHTTVTKNSNKKLNFKIVELFAIENELLAIERRTGENWLVTCSV